MHQPFVRGTRRHFEEIVVGILRSKVESSESILPVASHTIVFEDLLNTVKRRFEFDFAYWFGLRFWVGPRLGFVWRRSVRRLGLRLRFVWLRLRSVRLRLRSVWLRRAAVAIASTRISRGSA